MTDRLQALPATMFDAMVLLNQCLSTFLTGTQVQILNFILSRTFVYDHITETIPMRHFLNGVYKKDTGEVETYPIGLPNRTLRTGIEQLVELKLITKAYKKNWYGNPECRYTVLYDNWLIFAEEQWAMTKSKLKLPKHAKEENVCKLKEPKQVKAASACKLKEPKQVKDENNNRIKLKDPRRNSPHPLAKSATPPGENGPCIEEGEVRRKTKKEESKSEQPEKRAAQHIKEAVNKNKNKRKLQALAIDDPNPSYETIRAYWNTQVQDEDRCAVASRASQNDRGKIKRCLAAVKMPLPLSEFMQWSIDNWVNVRTSPHMNWDKKRMTYTPDMVLWGWRIERFINAYHDFEVRAGHGKHKATMKDRVAELEGLNQELREDRTRAVDDLRKSRKHTEILQEEIEELEEIRPRHIPDEELDADLSEEEMLANFTKNTLGKSAKKHKKGKKK